MKAGFQTMTSKKSVNSQVETDLTSDDLDIFDKKID
jgi:hypothetical protein